VPRVKLATLASARSGDKGDTVDISLFAPTAATYALLCREVTAARVQAHFVGLVAGPVERYEVPNVLALKFVLHQALDGGASMSLRSDSLGKCFGPMLLRLEIEVPDVP
jgi:hypothetical protein